MLTVKYSIATFVWFGRNGEDLPMASSSSRLRFAHTTRLVRDLEPMLAFYCDVLGFQVTNRGMAGDAELAFVSQDPNEHHQIVFIQGIEATDPQFMFVDHLAFRTGSIDDLRAIQADLERAGVEGVAQVSHGNAWSLYFTDPEGNGLECFVDSPFHVAQPYLEGLDLSQSDDEIEAATRADIEGKPEFKPMEQWRAEFTAVLDGSEG